MDDNIQPRLRVMTNTERWAARIVAAARSGASIAYVEEAEGLLNGTPIEPYLATAFCREAAAHNHRICDDEHAVTEANEQLAMVMHEFGLIDR